MYVHSFHLCPVQITVGLNTSIDRYCQMCLTQPSSIKKIYGSDFGEEFYIKCLSFFFFLNLKKYLQLLNCGPFVNI